jgi:hypothetical protein
MIPHTDGALRMLSQRLMTQLLPDLKSLYSLSDGALIGLLINAIADETAEGIHVNDHHDALTRILVSLHQKAEDKEIEALNQSIWAYLRRHSQRHKITAVP